MSVISPVASSISSMQAEAVEKNALSKDDFLSLLITQLTHQDPMNPMEDTEFIAQLAQFSSLEQLQNMNSSLDNSLEWDYLQMQTINNTMATSLIGREVQASYNGVYLDSNNQPTVSFTTDTYAEEVKVMITDINGNLVQVLTASEVPPGKNSLTWDGRDLNGNRVDPGYYSVNVTGTNANGNSFKPEIYIKGKVEGVNYHDGAAFLMVNGLEIPLAQISSIAEYNPESDSDGEEE